MDRGGECGVRGVWVQERESGERERGGVQVLGV